MNGNKTKIDECSRQIIIIIFPVRKHKRHLIFLCVQFRVAANGVQCCRRVDRTPNRKLCQRKHAYGYERDKNNGARQSWLCVWFSFG